MAVLLFSLLSSSAIEFDCDFNFVYKWDLLGQVYHCGVEAARNVEVTQLTAVNGKHLIGKGNDDVLMLYVWNTTVLSKIPSGIGQKFPYLKGLDWKQVGLKSISKQSLEQFPRLEYLSLSENQLVALDGDLFVNNPQLKNLNFSKNAIRSIDDDLLDELKGIQIADFSENECVNFIAAWDSSKFDELKKHFASNCSVEVDDDDDSGTSNALITFWVILVAMITVYQL